MANRREKQHSTSTAPTQNWPSNIKSTPVMHEETTRTDLISNVSSGFGGVIQPVAVSPVLREDAARSSRIRVNVQMAETSKMLLNAVRTTCTAVLVPKLALDRFKDMGSIDRSYNGQQEIDGSVIPWFEPETDMTKEFYTKLGIHAQAGVQYNTDYLASYNQAINHMYTQRSVSLAPRAETTGTLAAALWQHTQMRHVKPNFDDAMQAGTIPLTVIGAEMPVRGITAGGSFNGDPALLATGNPILGPDPTTTIRSSTSGTDYINFDIDPSTGLSQIHAELNAQGIEISLANIALARETVAWAQLRTQYQGLSEDWMIDQLLSGIRLRDETLQHPIILDQRDAVIGMTQRYATDSGNLDQSLTDGQTTVSLDVRFPKLVTSGVLLILAQSLPEQIYERQRDYYLAAMSPADLPMRTADELDPQPVSLVKNAEVDEAHTLPDDLFGYQPLNAEWQRNAPRVGGRYFRPDPLSAWTEDRNRLWEGGVVDPTLGPDFYLSSSLDHQVFNSATEDPFEYWTTGQIAYQGLTYFGPGIREADDHYDKVLAQVDTSRHVGDGTDT